MIQGFILADDLNNKYMPLNPFNTKDWAMKFKLLN
jgi:hypothetical protein